LTELDDLPYNEFHTLYYIYWREREAEKEAEKKMTDEEKGAAAFAKALEDNS